MIAGSIHIKCFSLPVLQKNRRRACEVQLESTSQARRRQRPAMVVVADGVCSHMSEQCRRQFGGICMRTRFQNYVCLTSITIISFIRAQEPCKAWTMHVTKLNVPTRQAQNVIILQKLWGCKVLRRSMGFVDQKRGEKS